MSSIPPSFAKRANQVGDVPPSFTNNPKKYYNRKKHWFNSKKTNINKIFLEIIEIFPNIRVRVNFNNSERLPTEIFSLLPRLLTYQSHDRTFTYITDIKLFEKLVRKQKIKYKIEKPPNSIILKINHYIHHKNEISLENNLQNKTIWQTIHPKLTATLYDFQKRGVEFIVNHNGRGLIGDDMGLGKTLQAIAIADYYQSQWPILICCPTSVKYNWKQEFLKFLPWLQPSQIRILKHSKHSIFAKDLYESSNYNKHKQQPWTADNDTIDAVFNGTYKGKTAVNYKRYDSRSIVNDTLITIVGYGLISRKIMVDKLNDAKFNFVICDESHYLKKSKCALLLSGTPSLSGPIELFTQISAIDSKLLGLTKYHFGVRYCDGKRGNFGFQYKGSTNAQELHLILKTFLMIRRKKSEVLSMLPPKVRTCILSDINDGDIQRLKNICPDFESLLTKILHRKKNKPAVFSTNQRQSIAQLYEQTGLAKVDACTNYIQSLIAANQKFLIFAHHKSVMNALEEYLEVECDKKAIKYFRLDGSTPAKVRQSYIDEFQSSGSLLNIGLLSLTAGCTGITLTAANLVVFAELYWVPSILLQAEDRVHRIKQKSSVLISYIIGNGTIDEIIWRMISRKLENVGNALDGKSDSFRFNSIQSKSGKKHYVADIGNGKRQSVSKQMDNESYSNNNSSAVAVKNSGRQSLIEDMDKYALDLNANVRTSLSPNVNGKRSGVEFGFGDGSWSGFKSSSMKRKKINTGGNLNARRNSFDTHHVADYKIRCVICHRCFSSSCELVAHELLCDHAR